MDKSLKRSLTDRIYEKRKLAALELEHIISDCIASNDFDKINNIITQLRNDFAYNIHDPYARYGGLIGLAAISIALGSNELPKYLNLIINPVIACFGDNDSNVRYYACEALYNIAKIAKGEILLYFNEIFDILSKLVADVENSVKNAADILDTLIKDIVCDKATNYISIINKNIDIIDNNSNVQSYEQQSTKAFSLEKFIPLLKERIYATNTYTRLFIVSWLILLNSIPDLQLISFLPSFLDPLLSYLKSPLKDVKILTENFLKLLLQEIIKINEIKLLPINNDNIENDIYIPGEDTLIDYPKIIDILINNLESNDNLIKSISLNWLTTLLSISPKSFNLLIPKLLIILLKIISNNNSNLSNLAQNLNTKLMNLISSNNYDSNFNLLINNLLLELSYNNNNNNSNNNNHMLNNLSNNLKNNLKNLDNKNNSNNKNDFTINDDDDNDGNDNDNYHRNHSNIDNSHNLIKLYSLDWLIMLQEKDSIKFMELNDKIFIILLKNLNCSNNKIINKILILLSKILNNSNDNYFNNFMIDLLTLFKKDSNLLNTKSNFIIKKICKSLNSEKVYISLSHVLLKMFNDDISNIDFIKIIVQILNNNLIIAPELNDLRLKLTKNNNSIDNKILLTNLFKCWSINPPSLICISLLTSNYSLSYKIINQMVNYEININTLIQLDLLIQLLESPIFAKLRLDLLKPVKNINLFKCLYGLLMLLPQSNSFKILQNRLQSISSIINLPNIENNNLINEEINQDFDNEVLNFFNNCQTSLELINKDEINKEEIINEFQPLDTSSII